jgi:hypothetical protein
MNVRSWHFATFGGTAKIGRHRGKADMAGPAVGSTRSRMTQTVQKRFSSPKNCTQPGTIRVDTTV